MRLETALAAAVILLGWGLACAPDLADARAGSGGSRGSRSYSAPAPTTPRSVTPPAGSGTIAARPRASAFSRVTGFMLGGLVAGIFLRALGLGGGWGIGLFDILLLIGGGYLLIAYLRERGTTAEPIVVGTRDPR